MFYCWLMSWVAHNLMSVLLIWYKGCKELLVLILAHLGLTNKKMWMVPLILLHLQLHKLQLDITTAYLLLAYMHHCVLFKPNYGSILLYQNFNSEVI